MMRTLSARAVDALTATFKIEADALVRSLVNKDSFDAVPLLAQAFPLKVFPDAVGIADEERENLLLYGKMVFNALGPDNGIRQRAMAAGLTCSGLDSAKMCT